MEDRSAELIGLLAARPARLASFGSGIRTAADHVRGVVGCMDDELCRALKMRDAPEIDRQAVLKESESRLVYANEETRCERTVSDVDEWFKAAKVERPPRTLAVVELIVTTPQEDRDGDILRTEGAEVDPSQPMLWHHMLPMPIGRMVQVLQHNSQRLKVASAIMDSPLGADTMHLVEFGALRISHGFRPLEFKPRRGADEKGNGDGTVKAQPGYEVLKFEILEHSVVTVPSNTGAVITAFSRGKLHDPLVKSWAKGIADARPCSVRGAKVPIPLPGPDCTWLVTPDKEGTGIWLSAEPKAPADGASTSTSSALDKAEMKESDGEPWDDSKPYAGEHAARLVEPGKFDPDTFRRVNNKFGAGIHAIFGKLKGEGTMTLQAIRFDAKKFTAAEAKKWLADHKYKPILFEPAAQEREAETADGKAAPLRWNKSLSPAFDVFREHLEPSRLEYDWVSRFVGVQVKHLFRVSTTVPHARIGTWLTGLRNVLAPYSVDDTRNITHDGKELPPQYEIVRLNSKLSDDFLIEGIEFRTGQGRRFAVKLEPDFRRIRVTFYSSNKVQDKAFVRGAIDGTWKWATENNFLKGEAFALSGEFLPKTAEGWGDVFLTAKNVGPIKRVVQHLNSKGAALPNRGMMFLGPPGTGKTLSGRTIRNEANATFVWVSARDFYYAGAIGGMTYAFDLAKELAPTVLFIEDVDNWLSASAVDVLKTEMDGIGRSTGVVTILTTNYPERMPAALIDRPGRFHDVLRFDLPDAKLRQIMLEKWLPEAGANAIVATVEKTAGYSGAHIYELCHFAKTLAEEESMSVDKALAEAVVKVEQQRELIDDAQLVDSRYRPGKDFGGRWKKDGAAAQGKSGRVLSSKNKASLQKASGMIAEADGLLKQVIDSQEEPESDDSKLALMGAMELFGWFLSKSNREDRAKALANLADAVARDKRARRTRALGRFFKPVR